MMPMLDLRDREWKPFHFNEIFTQVKRGKRLKKADHKIGVTPYVSSTAANNGVDGFISNTENVRKFGNSLTVANSGSVGATFYHKYAFVASDHVTQLKNPDFSRHIYLFLAPMVARLAEKYSFNREINDVRINNETLLLPVNDADSPDWDFMKDYIREREQLLIKNYVEHIRIDCECVPMTPLHEKDWSEFSLSSIFSINSTSSSIDKKNLVADVGKFPYITRTERNNGIDCFVGEQNNYTLDNGNCITVGLDTQTAFYQPTAFYTGQNIQILRNENLNANNANFILPLLKNLLTIFNWGSSGATLTRLRRSKIMLPVNSENNPDWRYMEQYSKSIIWQKLNEYCKSKR